MKKRRIHPPKKNVPKFVDFPDEIWLQIFKSLSTFDLLKFQLLNKRMNNLSNKILWHSIYVYHGSDSRAGTRWQNHAWMSMASFLHLSRGRKLKSQFMRQLTFHNSDYMSSRWLGRLAYELIKCSISFSKLTHFTYPTKHVWTNVGHFYVSAKSQKIDELPDIHSIKSLRIDGVDEEFYRDWLPRFTSLKSLYIDQPKPFKVKKKLRLKNLFLGNSSAESIIYDMVPNFDFSELESLSIRTHPRNWRRLSQGLFSIKVIELEDTIKHLPYYSLEEVHYLKDIPKTDLQFLLYHPIIYLSVNSPSNPDPSKMTLVNKIPTLRKLKLGNNRYRVDRSSGDIRYIKVKTNYDFE
ncbi:uncharacterized protein J8A68_000387 [[Candida] subhashii]|uniref:F-box domain-containing protein n=1 Tax=[Candida] subhashii TaxID=561895 RepID=A0A8J5R7A9_9ASCO|nr:uncharacterized protein J8A68_000387 [[Candida] subhashii]KAG7666130.1 hypothetical protein J8A68_000387 [[Candida] subhashii]